MAAVVRIPSDVYEKVKVLSQASGKPISRIVGEALELYIRTLEERLDVEIAEKRLLDPKAEFIPLDEVRKEYGLSDRD